MAKEKFERMRYLGPVSTLALGAVSNDKFTLDDDGKSIALITGQIYPDQKAKFAALPLDHPTVKSLIARKLLIEVTDKEAANSTNASKIETKEPSS